jgi:hypothetical protein
MKINQIKNKILNFTTLCEVVFPPVQRIDLAIENMVSDANSKDKNFQSKILYDRFDELENNLYLSLPKTYSNVSVKENIDKTFVDKLLDARKEEIISISKYAMHKNTEAV